VNIYKFLVIALRVSKN